MKKSNTIQKILFVIALLAVIGLSVFAYIKQQKMNNVAATTTQKQTHDYKKSIESFKNNLSEATELDKKLEVLKSLIDEQKKYSNESKDAENAYKDAVSAAKDNIITFINSVVKENTGAVELEKVKESKKELESLLSTVEKEKSVLFNTDEEATKLITEVQTLISSYNAEIQRVEALATQTQQAAETTITQQQAAPIYTAPTTPRASNSQYNNGNVVNNGNTNTTTNTNTVTPTQPTGNN